MLKYWTYLPPKNRHHNKVVLQQIQLGSEPLIESIRFIRQLCPKDCVQQPYLQAAPIIFLGGILIRVPGNGKESLYGLTPRKKRETNRRVKVTCESVSHALVFFNRSKSVGEKLWKFLGRMFTPFTIGAMLCLMLKKDE